MTPVGSARHRRAASPRVRRRRRLAGWLSAAMVAAAVGVAVGVSVTRSGGAPGQSASGAHSTTTSDLRVGSSTTTSTNAPATTSTTAAPPTVTISAVGDINFGTTPTLPADPSTYLTDARSALQGQIVFGNLEGTLTDSSATSKCAATSANCFAYRNPPSYAAILRAEGFTVLNSANNHSHDFGAQGVADTSAALQSAGIAQTGLPGQIAVVSAGGITVAFVGFAPYSDTNDLLDLAGARTLIERAKGEADLVVVYMHAGAEGSTADHVTGQEESYLGEDRGNPEEFAHDAIDDGADLVIASGPHVLRGMQEYDGHLIDYSLGNFAGYTFFSTAGDLDMSCVLTVTLAADGTLAGAQFTSLELSSVGQPSIDADDDAASFVNQLSTEDFGASAVTVLPSGQLSFPTLPN